MTKDEQIELVRDISDSVANGIISQIRQGLVPEEWDGKELRQLLVQKHSSWNYMLTPADKRRYRKTVAVRGL